MLLIAWRNAYLIWTSLCLAAGVLLAAWAYGDTSLHYPIEPGWSDEILAKLEHQRSEAATAMAIAGLIRPLPLLIVGLVLIWSGRRWR